MLGRKDYTKEELDQARTAVDQQLSAYKELVKAIDSATSDPKVTSALEALGVDPFAEGAISFVVLRALMLPSSGCRARFWRA